MIPIVDTIKDFLDAVDIATNFVEIGSEYGHGSTLCLADLAKQHGVNLLSVDIDKDTQLRTLSWKLFYNNVRSDRWPTEVDSIKDLDPAIAKECIEVHGWQEKNDNGSEENKEKYNLLINHPCIKWYNAVGSEWCKNYKTISNQKISVLYLDNFDYIYNTISTPDRVKIQITEYKEKWQIDMNNQNCQLEHFKQILYLTPHLANNCIVALDDTYLYNDCWVGKSGPVVIYLLAHDFKIVYNNMKNFVILKRNTNNE